MNRSPRMTKTILGTILLCASGLWALSGLSGCQRGDDRAESDGTTQSEQGPQASSLEGVEEPSGLTQDTSSGSEPETSSATDPQETDSDAASSTSGSESETGTQTESPDDQPIPEDLPSVTGTCPNWNQDVLRFHPAGLKRSRRVMVWGPKDPSKKGGALVFFWHGMGAHPTQATRSLGKMVEKVTSEGGWLVAPYPDPTALPVPWFSFFDEEREDDYLLGDEIVACALKDNLINPRRIHVMGMSAGAFQAGNTSFLRSNYIASVAMYSGGFLMEQEIPKLKDPSNPFAAMLLYGGGIDQILHVRYQKTSKKYLDALHQGSQFGILCNHRRGHTMPSSAHASVWQFFVDHPYKVSPEPYKNGLPDSFPDYCQ